jgi:hypothetical protein
LAKVSTQLSALSRIFSSAVFRELASTGKSAALLRLATEAEVLPARTRGRIADVFDRAFDILRRQGSRDEYIYKAALAHRVLMGTHSLRTAAMLTEFRVGRSKADVVILNGTTTVYEIKSERDSLSRLEQQIADYRKVFAAVFVVAGQNHVDALFRTMPADVGIMSLDHRGYMQTLRTAKSEPKRVSPEAIFESIQTIEAKKILSDLGVMLPNVPNTTLRAELRRHFVTLPPETVHEGMRLTLKKTRDLEPLSDFVKKLPDSLQATALMTRLRVADRPRLLNALRTPLKLASAW